jgi:hypothetical protein
VCRAGEADPVFLMLQTHTPEADFPSALGVALPLEGRHAWVFYDRVQRAAPDSRQLSALLAHVMAHEIAHLLQGLIRHSETGILKAQWSPTDCARMADFPLMFTRVDAILIRHGVEERHSRLLSTEAPGLANRFEELPSHGRRPLPLP